MFKRLTNKTLMQALRSACFVVLFVVATIAGFAAQNAKAAAGIPLIINYQARVTNATGTPITTATNMRFVIWDSLAAGSCVWSGWGTGGSNGCSSPNGSQVSITPVNGVFSVPLGDTTFSSQVAMQSTIFNDDSRYLEIQMYNGGSWETLGPRKRIFSAPYAMNSNMLSGLSTSASGGANAFVPVTDSSGKLTLTAGTTISGALVSLNDTSNFNTQINTGTSSGTVTIGNTGNGGAVGVFSHAALTLTGGAASSWGTTVGNLNLYAAGSGTGSVVIGSGVGSSTPDLFILDNKNDNATDPSGSVGAMYYNSNAGVFRCYQGAGWTNCIGSGGAPSLNLITSATNTNTLANAANAQIWNWGSLTTQTGLTLGGGSAMTTGEVLQVGPSTFVHTTAETGQAIDVLFTDASTNATGATTSITSGIHVGTTVSTSGAGLKSVNAFAANAPTLTGCATGACTWSGFNVNTQATGALSTITQNGLNIVGAGISAGTLNGVNIGTITSSTGVENAITIGTGWDTSILGVGTLTITSGSGTNLTLDSAGGTSVMNIGTANATSVSIGRTNQTTTVNGALTVIQLLTGNLGATISGATINLNNNSSFAVNIGTGTSTGAIAIGSVTGASGITERVGTGNYSLDGVAGSTYTIGASTTTGTITMGGTAQTGTMTLGSSSGTNILNIANGSGATTLNLANVQNGGSINLGAGMTTGSITIGGTGAQTGTIAIGTGTGAQAINIGTGGTGIKTIGIGTGAIDNVITIGTTTGASSLALKVGSGGLALTLGSDATGDMFYRDSGGKIARLADVATGSCIISGGVGAIPSWGSCAAAASSLQIAYNGGQTITTSSSHDIAFTLTSGNFTATGAGSISFTPSSAITLTAGAASVWSTSTGALTVDAKTALNLGTANATSVSIGKNGVMTTVNGNTTLGLLSGDGVTINAGTMTVANDLAVTLSGGLNGINFDSNTLSIDALNHRVGIGTAAPLASLDVSSNNSTGTSIYLENPANSGTKWSLSADGSGSSDYNFRIRDEYANASRFTIDLNGNVGIATDLTSTGSLNILSTGANPTIYNPSSGNGLILRGDTGGGQLRIVSNGAAWTDNQTTTYFQTTNNINNNVTFVGGTYGNDVPLGRLQFSASSAQMTDLTYNLTPIPTSILEAINSTATKTVFKIRGATSQSGDYMDINSVSGTGGDILKVGSNGVLALKGGATADITTIATAAGTGLTIAPAAPTATGVGENLVLNASAGFTTGAGGAVTIAGGAAAGASTAGGGISITTGAGGTTSGANSGALTIASGNAAAGTAGNISLDVGTSSTGTPTISIGATAATSITKTITIGASDETGTITVGSSSGTNIVNLGTGTGATTVNIGTGITNAKTIHIGDGAVGNIITIGAASGAASIAEKVGTGNYSLDGVAGSTYTIGASTTTGTIAVGGTAETGTMTLGSSSGTNIVNLGTGTGATTVNIGTGITNAKTINIGTGAVADPITIGNATASTSVTLTSPAGGTKFLGSGAVQGSTVTTLCINSSTGVIYLGNGHADCWSSSERFKHDIENLTLGIDAVEKFRPVSFTYNDSNLHVLGFIAEEVATIDPRLVTRDDDGTIRGIDQTQIVPILVKGIQDQQTLLGTYTMTGDDLSDLVANIQTETPHDPVAIINDKINNSVKFLTDFVAARVTAIRGYFDEVFMNKSHQKVLCVGDAANGGETCITKQQLDQLLSNQNGGNVNAPSAPQPVSVTPPIVDTPPADTNAPAPEATAPDANTNTPPDTNTPAPVATEPTPAPPADQTPAVTQPVATEPTPDTSTPTATTATPDTTTAPITTSTADTTTSP